MKRLLQLKTFEPKLIESKWKNYQGIKTDQKNIPTILFPPPNVTGQLHIGHALTISLQDAIIRWNRLRGRPMKWIPGVDHAGIATQTVVERKIQKELKKNRLDLGKEAFIEEIWKWKSENGEKITEQMKRMGGLFDWDSFYFTLDKKSSEAVQNAFIQLFDDGKIYRDQRLVQWSCFLETAISDIEVDYVEISEPISIKLPNGKKVEVGWLHTFIYPVVNQENQKIGEIKVATTRIETILGDQAVAIHPNDERYFKFHNQYVLHPFTKQKLPIILDEQLVRENFGTGAVKITPAHDYNDFECAKRHNLPIKSIFNRKGQLEYDMDLLKEFQSLDRFELREKVIEKLTDLGLYSSKTKNQMRLAVCSRTGDILEPMPIPQWYIKCKEMAESVLNDTKKGFYKVLPPHYENQWLSWLSDIQDWCVSRQLWWGHEIPLYKIIAEGLTEEKWVAASTKKEAEQNAKLFLKELGLTNEFVLEKDHDVLDTWFSAALLPLMTTGWDGKSLPNFETMKFIESGNDILFFWIARMALLSSYFSKKPTFDFIYLHPMVRDHLGRKMSKSLGNTIDPLDIIDGCSLEQLTKRILESPLAENEKQISIKYLNETYPEGIPECGSDALRCALIESCHSLQTIKLDVKKIQNFRFYGNKIWNMTRFSFSKFESFEPELPNPKNLMNQFILSRLSDTFDKMETSFEKFELASGFGDLYSFIWHDLCDVYLELSKPILNEQNSETKKETLNTLFYTIKQSYQMLHPFMPYLTQELWSELKNYQKELPESILENNLTKPNYFNQDLEKEMSSILQIIHSIRSLKTECKTSTAYILCSNEGLECMLEKYKLDIQRLSKVDEILFQKPEITEKYHTKIINPQLKVFMESVNQIEEKNIEILEKEKLRYMKLIEKLNRELNHPNFIQKAPSTVIEQKQKHKLMMEEELNQILRQLKQ